MPEDLYVEQRRQTGHKLELFQRYVGAWCTILARAKRQPFCNRRLWIVDTMAGQGLHLSAGDPDRARPGTPILALLEARSMQPRFPGTLIAVRAIEENAALAGELDRRIQRMRDDGTTRIDARTLHGSFVARAPEVLREINGPADHPHPTPGSAIGHQHRSLWFIDPFGISGMPHRLISSLGRGAEVVINLDALGLVRRAGRAAQGSAADRDLLDVLYGSRAWADVLDQDPARWQEGLVEAYRASFERYPIRMSHALEATGNQRRYMIHLTWSQVAADEFTGAWERSRKAGTIWAGETMTEPQRSDGAARLADRFRGRILSVEDMIDASVPYSRQQLRLVCRTATDRGLGHFDRDADSMSWLQEPETQTSFRL